jgi:phosphoglycerate dehydrogenase-like enzyme
VKTLDINAIFVMNYPKDKNLINIYCNENIKFNCVFPQDQINDEALASANVIIGDIFKEDWYDKTPLLKYYLLPYAGVPPKLIPILIKKNLIVSNIHCNSHIVAEHALAMLLALTRNIIEIDKRVRDGKTLKDSKNINFVTLSGKKILLIGYGSLGKAVEKIANGLSMEIDRFTSDMDKRQLHFKLSTSDVVCVCLPQTKNTLNFIGKNEFDYMKQTSILVNVARGEVVNERDLFVALKYNKIRGACVDTWYGYTKTLEAVKIFSYPFSELKNIIISPHVAFRSDNQQSLRVNAIFEYLENLANEIIINKVDLDKGY